MKFKNTKTKKIYKKAKPKKTSEFPRIYRNIPEKFNRDEVVFFVGFISILVAILIVTWDLYSNFTKYKSLSDERIKVLNEKAFWQGEVRLHPNYRDAYLNLAFLDFQLKNFEEARSSLDKSLKLDPNFEKGRELQKLLSNF